MKCIYVAQLAKSHDRDEMWIKELQRHSVELATFSTHRYEQQVLGVLGKFQKRLHFGSAINKMNNDLIDLCYQMKPDWVHFRLPLHFSRQTIKKIKNSGAILTCYYNDDPFSKRRLAGLHSRFIDAISLYDRHYVFRKKNIAEFYGKGAKSVSILAPFYSSDKLCAYGDWLSAKYEKDAVFIGHWEDDGRLSALEALSQHGYNVEVRGPLWDQAVAKFGSKLSGSFEPIFGKDFAAKYRNARAGICFFSKINNDNWTRRPLEIVASGGLLLCERTTEAMKHFKEGQEAFFFSTPDELIKTMAYIFDNPVGSNSVRERGYKKLLAGKYALSDRVDNMIKEIIELRST